MTNHETRMQILTMKFGGTSLGTADAIRQAAEIMKAARDSSADRVAVVASAVHGVTDELHQATTAAAEGDERYLQIIAELRDLHRRCAEALSEDESEAALAEIDELLEGFAGFCESVRVLGEAGPRALDHALSLGERMSVLLLAAALRQIDVAANAVNATDIIVTDDRFQDAAPELEATRRKVAENLTPILERGETPVITGFIGATPEGITTTLGRGGSDFSAGLIAACLESDELWIWTDVDGVMTADPKVVRSARTIEALGYQEVRELSYFGAKVLHPKTIQSVLASGIPIRVKNTFNPSHPGTLILPDLEKSNGAIKAITAVRNVSLITVEGKGMMGVPGIAARTFEAVASTGASVLLISQASSEQSICFAVPRTNAPTAVEALESEFELVLSRGNIDRIWAQDDITIVTVVGSGMRQTAGVAGQVFTATGNQGINVVAIAQGSSECSISLVVQDRDGDVAVRAIHELVIES
ncbi:MAG: aspartate kinase [Anaerolineae bacterium]|nr:MAG: aspartate kinase [Anaerolineae bacterium]